MSHRVTDVKRHKNKIEFSGKSSRINGMAGTRAPPYAAQGRRLRLLRQAEGYRTAYAFATHLGWLHSTLSQFEMGHRRIPIDKVLQLRQVVPGLDPAYLWDGDKSNLPLDLRRRLEAQEARENESFLATGCHG